MKRPDMTNGKDNKPLKYPDAKLRRIALTKQGLHNTRGLGSGSGKARVAAAIAHLGYVQIDTISVNDYRFALPRMNAIKSGEKHWFADIDKKLLKSVYKRIETEGPLRARDFADTANTSTGWWDSPP